MAEKYIKSSECEKYFYEHLDDAHIAGAMNAIDEMPAADVEPVRHGHWIDKTIWHRSFGEAYHECPACHAVIPGVPNTAQSYRDNYCQNCGAKMEEYKSDIT